MIIAKLLLSSNINFLCRPILILAALSDNDLRVFYAHGCGRDLGESTLGWGLGIQPNYNKSRSSLLKTQLKLVLSLFGIFAFLFTYQNCAKYSDQSPFEYSQTVKTSESTSSSTPLEAPSGVVDISIYETKISVGGICNVSADQKHYIEIQLLDQSNLPMQVRFEGALCPNNAKNQDCYRATQFRCENGQYYVTLPVDCSMYRGSSTSQYRMLGQLVTFDDKGNEIRDDNSKFDRFFSIAWDTSSCSQ